MLQTLDILGSIVIDFQETLNRISTLFLRI